MKIICETSGVRLDKYIEIEDLSRSRIQKLIEDGMVTVNGQVARGRDKLKEGDILVFEEEGRGYIKPVEEFVTIAEAIEDLTNIKDLR